MTTKELGDFGEGLALQFLRKKGFKIIDTNFRFGRNEVDIICKDGDEMVFVEVKTRQTAEIGPPWKAVTRTKQRQIIKCANHYLITQDIDIESRFDIISIVHNSYGTRIEHIDSAFYPRL
ncbi:MAG: YraN family protein [Brumimicrobium sp.]